MINQEKIIVSTLNFDMAIGQETFHAEIPNKSGTWLALDGETKVIVDFTTDQQGNLNMVMESDAFPKDIAGRNRRVFSWNGRAVLLGTQGGINGLLIRSSTWKMTENNIEKIAA